MGIYLLTSLHDVSQHFFKSQKQWEYTIFSFTPPVPQGWCSDVVLRQRFSLSGRASPGTHYLLNAGFYYLLSASPRDLEWHLIYCNGDLWHFTNHSAKYKVIVQPKCTVTHHMHFPDEIMFYFHRYTHMHTQTLIHGHLTHTYIHVRLTPRALTPNSNWNPHPDLTMPFTFNLKGPLRSK